MLRLLLFPFAIIYDLITRVRNHLYNIGQKSSFRFEVPVISVGNLNLGGSGKTPMTEYLIRTLSTNHKLATLSRGYGRRTRGFRIANVDDNSSTIGDEPFQMFRKFHDNIVVAVGEDRAFAIPNILQEHDNIDAIILDDAFQHRSVNPHFSILVTEYARPFTKDYVLPAGNLREARKGASRADVVVVTKCPGAKTEMEQLTADIRKYAGNKPVFFSSLKYSDPISFGNLSSITGKVLLVTGIARAELFTDYLKTRFELVKHLEFGDHHAFTESEVNAIHYEAQLMSDVSIVTTEKDMIRLLPFNSVRNFPWFYIPVEMEFLKNGSEFDTLIGHHLERD
ncbi:MAG TPA: tetraacyldisaccharide 4'-kinase [Cyclobacteriaceae bacterium]|nr:tetraacyldisaccharide 4'-kinase [Cyclobacteriaceae bacterium]